MENRHKEEINIQKSLSGVKCKADTPMIDKKIYAWDLKGRNNETI